MNKELETMDSIGFGGMKLIQGNGFRYGVDAVLLAGFTAGETGGRGMKRRRAPRILELGCGNGIVSLILSHKIPESTMLGMEIQTKEAERARRNARLNHLEERIEIRAVDVASIGETALPEKFNAVVTNPPYFRRGGAIPNDASAKYIARHETSADLDDFIRAAAAQLDREGELFGAPAGPIGGHLLFHAGPWDGTQRASVGDAIPRDKAEHPADTRVKGANSELWFFRQFIPGEKDEAIQI